MSAEGDQQCGADAAVMLEELREVVRGWHEGGIESRAALEKMADYLGIVEDTPTVMKDPSFAPRAGLLALDAMRHFLTDVRSQPIPPRMVASKVAGESTGWRVCFLFAEGRNRYPIFATDVPPETNVADFMKAWIAERFPDLDVPQLHIRYL